MLSSRKSPFSTSFVVTVALVVFYTLCRPEVGLAFLVNTPRIGLSGVVAPCELEGEKRMLCRKAPPMVTVFPSEQGPILSGIPHSANRRDTVDTSSEVKGVGCHNYNYRSQDDGKSVPKWRMKLKSAFKGLFMGYSDKDEAVQFEYEKNMGRFAHDLNDDVLSETLANTRLNFDTKAKEVAIESDDLLSEKGPNREREFATKLSGMQHSNTDAKAKRGEDSSTCCMSGEKTPRHLSAVGDELIDLPRGSTGGEKYHNDFDVQYQMENRKFGNAEDVAHLQRLFGKRVDDVNACE